MKILSILIARGGSKGIPRKNLAQIQGKPLVAYMIEKALQANFESDVVLSTEDEEIAAAGIANGALVPFMRPKDLAEDHVRSLPVVQHAINEMEKCNGYPYDIIVYLQPTAPLCRIEDIEACVQALKDEPEFVSAVTTVKVATHPFKMKRVVNGNQLINFIDQGFEDMRPRQELPPVYRRSGAVYASRRHVVMEENTLVGDPCKAIFVPEDTAVDIDRPVDLELVRYIMNSNKE